MLAEKMLQFKLPATHSVRIPAARHRALERTVLLGRASYSATKRMTIFKTARRLAVPVGSEEMDVRSRRVNSKHAWMGR